jgi:uncharacterized protein YndB with AHSA1/START domain
VTAEGTATARVERVLAAPPDMVYDAWVDAASLAGFIAPPPGTAEVAIDPRVGGRIRIVMTFPDRRTEIEGAYLVLERPHRISFSWRPVARGFDSVVTVTLEPHGVAQTLMTIVHTRLPAEWQASYLHGWGLIADTLAAAFDASR